MEYITSRKGLLTIRNGLFADPIEMERFDWFSLWRKRNWPYCKLLKGDVVYWYDSKVKKIVWKTEVLNIKCFHYSDKQDIRDQYPNNMSDEYYDDSPEEGYFFGYKVKVLEKLNIDKPTGFDFPRLGWLGVNNEIASIWFGRQFQFS
jgi:hypothetical protein